MDRKDRIVEYGDYRSVIEQFEQGEYEGIGVLAGEYEDAIRRGRPEKEARTRISAGLWALFESFIRDGGADLGRMGQEQAIRVFHNEWETRGLVSVMRWCHLLERKTLRVGPCDERTVFHMMDALSLTEEGREIAHDLNGIRHDYEDGTVHDLGRGGVLVVVEDQDGNEVAAVLLPGREDGLWYAAPARDGGERRAEGALYWPMDCQPSERTPTMIPRALAEWAVSVIVEQEDEPVLPCETRPVAHAVEGMRGMSVTVPTGMGLTGITPDPCAHRIARLCEQDWGFYYTLSGEEDEDAIEDWEDEDDEEEVLPGYGAMAPMMGTRVQTIRLLLEETRSAEREWLIANRSTVELRAACQVGSGMRDWGYFASCSHGSLQEHLRLMDFTPRRG